MGAQGCWLLWDTPSKTRFPLKVDNSLHIAVLKAAHLPWMLNRPDHITVRLS